MDLKNRDGPQKAQFLHVLHDPRKTPVPRLKGTRDICDPILQNPEQVARHVFE